MGSIPIEAAKIPIEESSLSKKQWLKIYLFASLAILEVGAFMNLFSWFWVRLHHAIVLGASAFLAPALAVLVYREWKNL